jgi:hypothetical protein
MPLGRDHGEVAAASDQVFALPQLGWLCSARDSEWLLAALGAQTTEGNSQKSDRTDK